MSPLRQGTHKSGSNAKQLAHNATSPQALTNPNNMMFIQQKQNNTMERHQIQSVMCKHSQEHLANADL